MGIFPYCNLEHVTSAVQNNIGLVPAPWPSGGFLTDVDLENLDPFLAYLFDDIGHPTSSNIEDVNNVKSNENDFAQCASIAANTSNKLECNYPLILKARETDFLEQQSHIPPRCGDPSNVKVPNVTNMKDFVSHLNVEHESYRHVLSPETGKRRNQTYLALSSDPQDKLGRTQKRNVALSKRKRLSKEAVSIMRNWYNTHFTNPNQMELYKLASEARIEVKQVKSWFKNERSKEPNSEGDILKRRNYLPDSAVAVLRKWLDSHLEHPYPTTEERGQIAKEANITKEQVYYWFENYRKRKSRNLKIRAKLPVKRRKAVI